ncbi:MAG: hypothetical protein ACUVTX_09720, partial [Bacteroidales bacterium]
FLFFITPAIYIRGFISLLKRALIIIFPVIADILIIVSCIFATIYIWEIYKYGGAYYYPRYFIFSTISAFVLAGVFSVYIAGGYKRPAEPVSVIKGLLAGCTLLLVVYALLPQEMRFSRAVMLLGSASVILIVPLFRILMAIAGAGCYENPFRKVRKALIVSNKDSYLNICTLINKTESHSKVEGRVSLTAEDLDSEVLGNIEQLKEVIRINRINEVFFSLKDLSASQIIELMNESANTKLKIKLVSEGEKIIIGSKAVTM